ncbi:glycosyltransferase family protein [Sphingopyxis sp. RIFCSPHIGHO2_12_FULL_65_19]|uniref:glycosyltransferase n=1 Tax=Sphingopyxis sp. RIFCSPHIGHO2_12_FULL_65_19 TaxID=1802172 RepID=UPI0025D72605|nr:glycosyltransferase [Sphingopyxis sp. RIFCSPHIGHO2_12_FULL_65_19]
MTDAALTNCRLMVATPIYEGAQGTYVRAALDLALRAQAMGVAVRFEFILYQPSITRARNMLTAMFLASDCTHMLFVDADIDFSPDDVFSMVRAMEAHPEIGVLGGAYPRRMVNWGNVARAVELGLAKDNPADLARYAGEFALHFLHPAQNFRMTDLVELSRLGTAMMLIRRAVFDGLRSALPELVFRPDPAERQTHGVGELESAFFCPMIESESQALLSDDYAFCRRVRDAGFRIWLAPWVRTTHAGPTVFSGTLADTAQLFSSNPASSPE